MNSHVVSFYRKSMLTQPHQLGCGRIIIHLEQSSLGQLNLLESYCFDYQREPGEYRYFVPGSEVN